MQIRRFAATAHLLTSLVTAAPTFASAEMIGVASVIDGDTISIHGQSIRLDGIDAPESSQLCGLDGKPWKCGQAAANALADHIGRKTVICYEQSRDRYGRPIASCTVAGMNVSAWVVREGWALAFRKYSRAYVDDEAAAKAAKRGIWRGTFIPPWEWRAQRAGVPAASTPTPTGCRIKGNLTPKGERVYYAPGARGYAQTQVNPSRGERWFCTEAEAIAAGWRAAGQ